MVSTKILSGQLFLTLKKKEKSIKEANQNDF